MTRDPVAKLLLFGATGDLAQRMLLPSLFGLHIDGFLPKLDTDPYFQVAKTGAEEAQKEMGGSVIQQAPSSATADAQIEFINNLVSQKVNVIAIAGNDANAVAPETVAPLGSVT